MRMRMDKETLQKCALIKINTVLISVGFFRSTLINTQGYKFHEIKTMIIKHYYY